MFPQSNASPLNNLDTGAPEVPSNPWADHREPTTKLSPTFRDSSLRGDIPAPRRNGTARARPAGLRRRTGDTTGLASTA